MQNQTIPFGERISDILPSVLARIANELATVTRR